MNSKGINTEVNVSISHCITFPALHSVYQCVPRAVLVIVFIISFKMHQKA